MGLFLITADSSYWIIAYLKSINSMRVVSFIN